MYRDISLLAIFIGLIVSQVASYIGATVLLVVFAFVYGNEVLVAFFDYPSSIIITMALSLLAISIGGYSSMSLSKKTIINPLIVGILSLILNIWLMYLIDFKYGNGYFGILIISAILIIPSSLFGGYVYQRRNS